MNGEKVILGLIMRPTSTLLGQSAATRCKKMFLELARFRGGNCAMSGWMEG